MGLSSSWKSTRGSSLFKLPPTFDVIIVVVWLPFDIPLISRLLTEALTLIENEEQNNYILSYWISIIANGQNIIQTIQSDC